MNCPRCQCDTRRVLHTFPYDDFIKRQCYCTNCGIQFDTKEVILNLYCYSGELKKSVAINLQIQKAEMKRK
jgi:transcriptional regulator NrdR family protein